MQIRPAVFNWEMSCVCVFILSILSDLARKDEKLSCIHCEQPNPKPNPNHKKTLKPEKVRVTIRNGDWTLVPMRTTGPEKFSVYAIKVPQ